MTKLTCPLGAPPPPLGEPAPTDVALAAGPGIADPLYNDLKYQHSLRH